MVFSNKELKNMAYRSANLGMRPQEDFILDEKKIINGYKTKKYGLNERIGELGESLSDHIRKMDLVKGQLSKEVVALNKSNTAAIEEEIIHQKGLITHQKTDIKNHIRRCQLNGDTLESTFNVDEINSAEDFEPVKEKPKAKSKDGSKRIPIWLLYVIEVIFIFGEGVLFYNILTETHDLPEIILRSIFFIPIVFAASFLTSRKIPWRWIWLPTLLIVSVYAILSFTVAEWFFESQALEETLTFTDFFIKNGFLILGAVMMVTLALFLSNAVKSIYNRADGKTGRKREEKPVAEVVETIEKSPQQLDLNLKFHELKGAYKRLKKLEYQLIMSHETGKNEFKRIIGDVSVLEQKAAGVSEKIGDCEKELSTLEIDSLEELSKYREHFENYLEENQIVTWKGFDFTKI